MEIKCIYSGSETSPCQMTEKGYSSVLKESCEEGDYGRRCASVITQMAILSSINQESLESRFDEELGLIEGYFTVQQAPSGEAPIEIRESLIGRRLPLREGRPTDDSGVLIHHADLILTLMNYEQLTEANWYSRYIREEIAKGNYIEWWLFSADDGSIDAASKPRTSVEAYDQSFMMGSASLYNTMNPPLLAAEVLRRHKPEEQVDLSTPG